MMRRWSRGLLLLVNVAWAPLSGSAQRASLPAGQVMLSPEDIPDGPQETTATAGKSTLPEIHQWGILTVKPPQPPVIKILAGKEYESLEDPSDFQLSLPDFVHTTETKTLTLPRLEFSALYVHPPLGLSAPLKLDVTMQLFAGVVDAWYPYAARVSKDLRRGFPPISGLTWSGVWAGVAADGLTTTHSAWMTARAVESPATLKVYKPGPAGTKPDDVGTTEGDVFLFLRGRVQSSLLQLEPKGDQYILKVHPATSGTLHAWEIRSAKDGASGNVLFGFATGISSPAPGGVAVGKVNAALPAQSSAEELTGYLNEALRAQGLDAEESSAMTRVAITMMSKPGRYVFVLLPQKWADTALPLHIEGSPVQSPVRVFAAIGILP